MKSSFGTKFLAAVSFGVTRAASALTSRHPVTCENFGWYLTIEKTAPRGRYCTNVSFSQRLVGQLTKRASFDPARLCGCFEQLGQGDLPVERGSTDFSRS